MANKYYRVANEVTKQGLWYNSEGVFTGLIHNKFNFCKHKDLPMDFDPDLVGWLSATDSLTELFNWFPESDIKKLQEFGYAITVYETPIVKEYHNHLVICQKSSIVINTIKL